MLKRSSACISLWLILAAAAFAAQAPLPYPEVGPGIEYIQDRIGDQPWAIHAVKIGRSRADLRLVSTLATGTIYGLAPLSEQIASLPPALGKPVAAVNADFFIIKIDPYQGDPCGLQICQGEFVSSPEGRAAFWVDPAGQPRIGTVQSKCEVTWPDGSRTPFSINQQRNGDAAVVYTPTLGHATRARGGKELILERAGGGAWLPVRPGQTCLARIRSVNDAGNSELAPDAIVLSLGPKLLLGLPPVPKDASLKLSFATEPDLTGVTTAVGGSTILLAGGKQPDWAKDQPRQPRTAIGWNTTHLVLVVVDGRQAELSAGMTLPELADQMARLGCTEALNLDGGGSSTLWLGGRIMNWPSEGRERAVANGLVVVRSEKQNNLDGGKKDDKAGK